MSDTMRSIYATLLILSMIAIFAVILATTGHDAVERWSNEVLAPSVYGAPPPSHYTTYQECVSDLAQGPYRVMSPAGAAKYCKYLPRS